MSEDAAREDVVRPVLRIVRGEPSAEDVAVVAAVFSSIGDDAGSTDVVGVRGGWRDPVRTFARMPIPGPNAWRSSGW